jgi:hypothetical protein
MGQWKPSSTESPSRRTVGYSAATVTSVSDPRGPCSSRLNYQAEGAVSAAPDPARVSLGGVALGGRRDAF